MEYEILTVKATGFLDTDFRKAGDALADEVNRYIADGWEPQGGVCYGETQNLGHAYLMQAMIRRRRT